MSKLQSLIVIYYKNPTSKDSKKPYIKVFKQESRASFKENTASDLNDLPLQDNSEPTFLDINGDMKMDVLYVTPETSQKPSEMMVALGVDTTFTKFEMQAFSNFIISSSEDDQCKDPSSEDLISTPHSNAFVDLDGDCMPDLFIQKQRITERSVLSK
mmetsp:Transcript_13353/g.22704  ORF Transcript_13353/g.22704 Transcript_13353/m.22704 type:complete len:157 (+) Transcript_13353:459-929(+)